MYPQQRPRRLRVNPAVRELVREHSVDPSRLIYPLFITDSRQPEVAVQAMPGVSQFSVDRAAQEAVDLHEKGLKYFLLFGVPDAKDSVGSGAYAADGAVQRVIRKIKEQAPSAVIFTDVCLCPYTDHGHCGIIKNNRIHNDSSVEALARSALSHAQAGADFVAPSDMMDGRVHAIRQMLDKNGFEEVGIMAYSAKYASAFYGPFREAAHSAPAFGDRRTHQMDPANRREALKEIEQDIEEGADIVMVKPALSYMDIIREAKDRFLVPVAAYNVSGEYSMVKAAAEKGWIDEKAVRNEILLSMFRAGADIIISYFAKDLVLER